MTIADQIRRSENPSKEAYKRFSRRELPYDSNVVIFYFEDESSLKFKKVYELINDWVTWDDKDPQPTGQVRVRFRTGREGVYPADALIWKQRGRDGDIVEYFKL